MQKLCVLLSVLFFSTILFAQNPVPNSSFENWSFSGTPIDWENSIGYFKTDTSHSGYYAMKGEIIPQYLDCQINSIKFPVNGLYPALRFYYKFVPASGADEFQVSVAIADSANQVVAIGEHTISYVTDSFVEEILGITPTIAGGTPTQAAINFSIKSMSVNGPTVGTYLVIDDVEMYDPNLVTGAGSVNETNRLTVYPSPASNYAQVILPTGNNLASIIKLFDIYGNLVSSSAANAGIVKLDVENMPSGTYLLVLSNAGYTYTRKVQVLH